MLCYVLTLGPQVGLFISLRPKYETDFFQRLVQLRGHVKGTVTDFLPSFFVSPQMARVSDVRVFNISANSRQNSKEKISLGYNSEAPKESTMEKTRGRKSRAPLRNNFCLLVLFSTKPASAT
jgi:hypothetical protein